MITVCGIVGGNCMPVGDIKVDASVTWIADKTARTSADSMLIPKDFSTRSIPQLCSSSMVFDTSEYNRDDHAFRRRRRQPHRKSRSGCANCRYRRVKCDEQKPTCRRCRTYMVPCAYGTDVATLSSFGEEVVDCSDKACNDRGLETSKVALTPLWTSPGVDKHHEVIFRFRNRTVLTMGATSTVSVYATAVPRLAMQHTYLLHIVIATTLLHDRALAGSTSSTSNESYHLSQGAAKFNNKLSSPLNDDDRDALWATAVYMCATTVFNVHTHDPEKSWPLISSSSDLEWLHLQAGLRIIWSISDLHRPNGAFAFVGGCSDDNCVFPRTPAPGIDSLPPVLVELCDLNEYSDGANSQYHTAVRHLAWLLPMECTSDNLLTYMIFAGGMTKDYRSLLYRKDPRALLLLAIWYSRLFNSCWWMVPRAIVECKAICIYLTRLNIKDPVFQKVLELLKNACKMHDLHSQHAADVAYLWPRVSTEVFDGDVQQSRQSLIATR